MRQPIVTDHALVRYMERVIGIDVGTHRRALERKVAEAVSLGACGLVSDGWRYAISDTHIVTVMPAHSEPLYARLRPQENER